MASDKNKEKQELKSGTSVFDMPLAELEARVTHIGVSQEVGRLLAAGAVSDA